MEMMKHDRRDRPFATRERRPASLAITAASNPDEHLAGPSVEWPSRPLSFSELLTPVEAAQYLRLDEVGQRTPTAAVRTLNYWRDQGELKATKFARRVWYRKAELDRFIVVKTEQ